MYVTIESALDTTSLKAYLQQPFCIAPYQCFSKNNAAVFIDYSQGEVDYYGIPLIMEVVTKKIKKHTILSVVKTDPYHILKQLAFFEKCKDVDLDKQRYMYAQMLAKQLAEVQQPSCIAKPAANDMYNCYYKDIPWEMNAYGHKVSGVSTCLVASRDIKVGEGLLFQQEIEQQEETKAKIINCFPVVFKLNRRKWLYPKNAMDVPVYLDGQLTNFIEVKEKEGPFLLKFPELDTYYTRQSLNTRVKHRIVELHFNRDSKRYNVIKIINPII
ncbi:MAG: hypothetical protein CMH46_00075 [Muricauda sp.]|nr:hypothetical protein [Allomuricauda sp.]MAU13918.1 hypothetical protein [Allomuricauda sp.]